MRILFCNVLQLLHDGQHWDILSDGLIHGMNPVTPESVWVFPRDVFADPFAHLVD